MSSAANSAGNTAPLAPVSVIIPCYQSKEAIDRAIQSIADQSLRPAEIILVDDFSPDDTLETLEQIAARYPTDWIRIIAMPENVGAASARNRGWNAARHPLIAFLDDDDAWHPLKIEIQYEHMRRHPALALSAHESVRLATGETLPESITLPQEFAPRSITRNALLLSNRFITPSVMLRRDIPFRFLEGRRHMEDHLLWLRIACSGLTIDKLPLALAYTFKAAYGDAGLSSQMLPMAFADLSNYRQLRLEGLISGPLAWVLYGYSVLKTIRRWLLYTFSRFRPTPDHP